MSLEEKTDIEQVGVISKVKRTLERLWGQKEAVSSLVEYKLTREHLEVIANGQRLCSMLEEVLDPFYKKEGGKIVTEGQDQIVAGVKLPGVKVRAFIPLEERKRITQAQQYENNDINIRKRRDWIEQSGCKVNGTLVTFSYQEAVDGPVFTKTIDVAKDEDLKGLEESRSMLSKATTRYKDISNNEAPFKFEEVNPAIRKVLDEWIQS